jgi:hypothetical protein
VAVTAGGIVGVTHYDFRNNTPAPGLLTDYWIVHADNNFTDPASWSQENRITDASFDLELAPRTSRGFFVGDYEGLATAGDNFDALFSQAVSTSDPASIFFRDPPPAPGATDASPTPATAAEPFAPDGPAGDLAFLGRGTLDTPGPGYALEGNGPRSDNVHFSSGLGSQTEAVLPGDSGLDQVFLSTSARERRAVDRLFADAGDALFSDALGSDVASVSVD